ncbi:MAG: T9SS type A sorting domain-containing protein [bacterium]|nr:T9SS type A sorting domain-containing protein [bacterium]
MVSRTDDLAQLVWTVIIGDTIKLVHYNVWDFSFNDFLLTSPLQVNGGAIAAAPTQATHPDGICLPAFQEIQIVGTPIIPMAAIDFLAGAGAFTSSGPLTSGFQLNIGEPKIALSANDAVHLVSRDLSIGGSPKPIFYSRGVAEIEMGFGFGIQWQFVDDPYQLEILDSVITLGHIVAASQTGSRIAVLYARHPDSGLAEVERRNTDIYLRMSEDGGTNFDPPRNLTEFIQADVAGCCGSGNFECCNRDTLRAFDHISALFDDEGVLHIAYTAIGYYHMPTEGQDSARRDRAMLWHWDDMTESHHLIAEHWIGGGDSIDAQPGLGSGRAILEHPSLAFDDATGYLYCAYLKYDTAAHLDGQSILNADVFVSRSQNSGLEWSVGANITSTPPENNQNRNEQELSVAPNIVSSQLTCEYLLHKASTYDSLAFPESDVCLAFVNLDDIAFGPNVPQRSLHVATEPCDSSVTLISVSQDLCDSVLLSYQVLTLNTFSHVYFFRDGQTVGIEPVVDDQLRVYAHHTTNGTLGQYSAAGWTNWCGHTTASDTLPGRALQPPSPVDSFRASRDHHAVVRLTWVESPGADSVDYYSLYRDNLLLGSVPPGVTEFVDATALPDVVYAYGISAHNHCGDGDPVSDPGGIFSANGGQASLSLLNAGPPSWDYQLNWIQGCVNRPVIHSLCPGTSAEFIGATWQVTQYADSVVFVGEPLCESMMTVAGFRLTNTNPNCIGDGTWSAGQSGGTISGPLPAGNSPTLPAKFSVAVYPNPFNPSTTLRLELPQSAFTTISIYNVNGQLVRVLTPGFMKAGYHSVSFDGHDLASGLYFATMRAAGVQITQKLILMK